MRKALIGIALFIVSCGQKDLPLEVLAQPIFSFAGMVNQDSVLIAAGSKTYGITLDTIKGVDHTVYRSQFSNSTATDFSMTLNYYASEYPLTLDEHWKVMSYPFYTTPGQTKVIDLIVKKNGVAYYTKNSNSSSQSFQVTEASIYNEVGLTRQVVKIKGNCNLHLQSSSGDTLRIRSDQFVLAMPLN